jgi:hypothetical protein
LSKDIVSLDGARLPDFFTLNCILYRLLPERPFRLYQQDQWQPLDSMHSVSTVEQLIQSCDRQWPVLVYHLYGGALLTWLKYSQQCLGIDGWYQSTIALYAQLGHPYQSVGLEFLLEHLSPSLPRPAFAIEGVYSLVQWDSEIHHEPLPFVIQNITRGATFFYVMLEIRQNNAFWMNLRSPHVIQLQNAPIDVQSPHAFCGPFYSGLGRQDRIAVNLLLQDLPHLGYGKTYHAVLRLMVQTADKGWSPACEGSIVISTMEYQQGFRRHLWRWGLRGGLPGLIENAIAGLAMSLIIFLLVLTFVHVQYSDPKDFFNTLLLASIDGMGGIVTSFLGYKFILITGAVTGILGSLIGWKEGHAHYSATKNAKDYTSAGKMCCLLFFLILLYLSWGYEPAGVVDGAWLRFAQVVGSLLTSLLFLIVICILVFIRFLVEWLLRQSYSELLKPQGSQRS